MTTEVRPLVTALVDRLGRAERVTYNLTAWQVPSRSLVVEDQVVRLEGFRSQHPDTVTVIGPGGQRRLTLLTVPPTAVPASARRTLTVAAEPDNVASPEVLLSDQAASATQRWEAEGGACTRSSDG